MWKIVRGRRHYTWIRIASARSRSPAQLKLLRASCRPGLSLSLFLSQFAMTELISGKRDERTNCIISKFVILPGEGLVQRAKKNNCGRGYKREARLARLGHLFSPHCILAKANKIYSISRAFEALVFVFNSLV